MKKIRSGNDIQITWTITKNEGVTIDLSEAKVFLIDALKQPAVFDYTIDNLTITGTFYGKDQHTRGKYRLLLVNNCGQEEMLTLDYLDAFILVDKASFGVVEGSDEGNIATVVVEVTSDISTSMPVIESDTPSSDYYTKEEVNQLLETKQATLISGTNIKTINNESILGSGNITIQGGGGDFIFSTPLYMQDSSLGTEVFLKGGNNTIISGIVESGDEEGWSHAGNSALPTVQAVKSKVDLKVDASNVYTKTQTNNLLAGKQDSLVSGTNIKTINSLSLLGSGNIAVQAPLVSGTNIKTINSLSLLGSGNIALQKPISTLGVVELSTWGGTANTLRLMTTPDPETEDPDDPEIPAPIYHILTSNTNVGPHGIWTIDGDYSLPTCGLLKSLLEGKQDSLVSGTNIKTINNESILGSGNIVTPNTTYSSLPNTALVMNSDNEFYLWTDDERAIERVFDYASNDESAWETLGDHTDTQQPGNNVNGDVQLATLKYIAFNTMPDFEVTAYDCVSGTLKINHSYCISISEDNQFEYTFDTSVFDTAKPNKIGYVNIILSLDTTGLQGPQVSFGVPQNSNITVYYMSGSKDFLNNFDNKSFDIDASFQGERQFNIMIMYNSHWHEMYVNIAEIDL